MFAADKSCKKTRALNKQVRLPISGDSGKVRSTVRVRVSYAPIAYFVSSKKRKHFRTKTCGKFKKDRRTDRKRNAISKHDEGVKQISGEVPGI